MGIKVPTSDDENAYGLLRQEAMKWKYNPCLLYTSIFVHFIMFIMIFILSVNFWTYGRMIYELDLLKEMIVIVLGLASIFIVVIVFIYFLLRIFISIKNLKSSSFSSKNIIYIMILKVIVLSLMTAPMMELIEQCYHCLLYTSRCV